MSHVLLRPSVPLTVTTHSVGSDAQDINWQSVFNHAVEYSLTFESGDALSRGRISKSLQAVTSIDNNATAGRVRQQAIQAGELRETADGYKIVRDGPGTGDIRQSLDTTVQTTMENGENGVIESPTSSGKTHKISTTRWRSHSEITGDEPVVLLSGTTDARDDAIAKTKASHALSKTLEGRDDACPLSAGEYDRGNDEGNIPITAPDGSEPSAWFTTMCKKRGFPVSVAHGKFEREHDGTLPCCENGEKCRSKEQWTDIPRNDDEEVDYDVLHATHQFAQVPRLIEDCNVVIDELPDFTPSISSGQLKQMVRSYLSQVNTPIESLGELITGLTKDYDIGRDQLQDALTEPDSKWFTTDSDAHALAPGIVEAIVTAEEWGHELWVGTADYTYPTLNPNHEGPEQKSIIRVVFDSKQQIRLLQAIPDFSEARCVIGLDAYPTMSKWKGNTLRSIEAKQIVSNDERHKWRRNQRNLTIVQVGDNKNTWTRQNYNDRKMGVLCNALRRKYGDGFTTGITSKQYENKFRKQLVEAGIETPETTRFGNQKSVEIFGSEWIGLVAGCISPSSDHIKTWLALLDKDATPKREAVDGHYQGQEWVGEDADVARELLADVREKEVLQACGRYARSPQQPDDGATVFVLTNVLPDEYVDKKVDDVDVFREKEKQILDYIASNDGVSASTIEENTDSSRSYIHDTLNECRSYSWMNAEEQPGHNNPTIYSAEYSPDGYVEL